MRAHIYVCPLSKLKASAAALKPSHVVTLLDPGTPVDTPPGVPPERHLRLGVHDVSDHRADHVVPAEDHVATLIDFVSGWDRRAPMLIHCWAGISRSTASAFLTLCLHNPEAPETELARLVRSRAPHAHPNRLIVAHADRLLGRQGRMIRAVEALGPGRVVYEGELFGVPAHPEQETRL